MKEKFIQYSAQEGRFTENAKSAIMAASQQDIVDKINTAEVKKTEDTLIFSDEWDFPLSHRLLILCLPLRHQKELYWPHRLSRRHPNEVLSRRISELSCSGGSGWPTAARWTARGTAWGWGCRRAGRLSPLRRCCLMSLKIPLSGSRMFPQLPA